MADGDLRVTIDTRKLTGDVLRWAEGVRAVEATVTNTGSGQVLTSARKKLPGEKGRALHGRGIANIFMDRGKDVFLYENHVADAAESLIAANVDRAMATAFESGRPQTQRIKNALLAAAYKLSKGATDFVKRGGLGQKRVLRVKRSAWTNYWTWQVRRGKATTAYGNPPPYGVKSGRFVAGVRGFWTLGRRQ